MSLYRQTGASRWRTITVAIVVVLIAGGAVGYVVGRNSAPEPTLAEKVADLRAEVQPVLDGLSLVPDHYEQGLAAGGEVQLDGAVQQADFARESFVAEAASLRLLSAEGYETALAELDALLEAMRCRAAVAVVRRRAADAERAVAEAVGATPAAG